MFKKNDRMKLVRPIDDLQKIGEIFKVVNIIKHYIVLISEETGEDVFIPDNEINVYFEKVKEPDDKPLNGVPYEKIEKLMAKANVKVTTFFDKTTVVVVQFPNGFVITESSSCVDPRAYSEEVGKDICLNRIKERLWELEGYFLQEQEYTWNQSVAASKHDIPDILEKPKKEVTPEIARVVYNILRNNFVKQYEGNKDHNLDEIYIRTLEKTSKDFNVDKEDLESEVDKIFTENIHRTYKKTLPEIFAEIFGISSH